MIKTLAAMTLAAACLLPAGNADDMAAPSADSVRPLLIGATVPAVTLTTGNGEAVELGALLSRKSTVVVFYRGGW
jgi:hypothetical protein